MGRNKRRALRFAFLLGWRGKKKAGVREKKEKRGAVISEAGGEGPQFFLPLRGWGEKKRSPKKKKRRSGRPRSCPDVKEEGEGKKEKRETPRESMLKEKGEKRKLGHRKGRGNHGKEKEGGESGLAAGGKERVKARRCTVFRKKGKKSPRERKENPKNAEKAIQGERESFLLCPEKRAVSGPSVANQLVSDDAGGGRGKRGGNSSILFRPWEKGGKPPPR